MRQIGYIRVVRVSIGMIFVAALLLCSVTLIGRQSIYAETAGIQKAASVSVTAITTSCIAQHPRGIKNSRDNADPACIAVKATVPASPYTVSGSRSYTSQASNSVINILQISGRASKCRILASFTQPLHHYPLVLPHHHFW
ncbi:hypothetical protein ACX0G7_19315 [Flavitalea antarctica]